MGGQFTEHLAIRASPDQRGMVEDAAEREGVTPTELMREGVVLRARQAEGAMLVALEPDVARRVRAAAEIEDMKPETWAVAVLDELAARRLAGTGLGFAISRTIEAREGDDGQDVDG